MLTIPNLVRFNFALSFLPDKLERKFAQKIQRIMFHAMESLTRKTPVNSGKAVRNYIVSTDTPYTGGALLPVGSGPIEPTNHLPLGAESRRPANTALAKATLSRISVRPNPYRKYFITNKAENIAGLEHGELPLPPLRPRSPYGMFAVTVQELIARLQAGAL